MVDQRLLALLVLYIITFMAALYDVKTYRIPNIIPFLGIIAGLVIFHSPEHLLYSVLSIVFLFFFGMLGFMGVGDIKLWMAISVLIGFTHSCFIIVAAAIFLIIHQLVVAREDSTLLLKISLQSLVYNRKVITIEGQKQFPFALYIFVASTIYAVVRIILLLGGI